LSQKPLPFKPSDIPVLVEKLRPYGLTKTEMIMIINLRPNNAAALNACIEEIMERFNEDQQSEILDVIAQVLGSFPVEPEDAMDADGANNGADIDPIPSTETPATS
jgi:hypothetical protein